MSLARDNDYGYIPPGSYGLNGNLKGPITGNLSAACGCTIQPQQKRAIAVPIPLKNNTTTLLPPAYTQGRFAALLGIIFNFKIFSLNYLNKKFFYLN